MILFNVNYSIPGFMTLMPLFEKINAKNEDEAKSIFFIKHLNGIIYYIEILKIS